MEGPGSQKAGVWPEGKEICGTWRQEVEKEVFLKMD